MLTVACVFVRGHGPFTVEYVAKLRAMVAKHLSRPHRFVCLTDRPDWMPDGVESIAVPPVPAKVFAWWAKVNLFNPYDDLGTRTLYLDLDTVIVDALDPIVDFPAPFALIPDAGTFKPKTGHLVVKRFNHVMGGTRREHSAVHRLRCAPGSQRLGRSGLDASDAGCGHDPIECSRVERADEQAPTPPARSSCNVRRSTSPRIPSVSAPEERLWRAPG